MAHPFILGYLVGIPIAFVIHALYYRLTKKKVTDPLLSFICVFVWPVGIMMMGGLVFGYILNIVWSMFWRAFHIIADTKNK